MSYIPFDLIGVTHAGVPNREHICIRATEGVELRRFFVGLGIRRGENLIDPINDNSFWLGNNIASQNDWIFLYTGSGLPNIVDVPNQTTKILSFFWGRSSVLFRSPEIIPYIYEIESVRLPSTPSNELPSPDANRPIEIMKGHD